MVGVPEGEKQGDKAPHEVIASRKEELIKAKKYIRRAWIFGLIWGVYFLIEELMTYSRPLNPSLSQVTLYRIFVAILILGLSFGIYKKSRVCSVSMMIFPIFNILILMIRFNTIHLVWSIVLGYFITIGIIGTFKYHQLKQLGKIDVKSPINRFLQK